RIAIVRPITSMRDAMTSTRWHWLGCAVTAVALHATPAAAQQSQSWTWCVNKDHAYSNDQAIKGCTGVIQAGKETQRDLAIAYNNRGIAHYANDDYDKSIADFTQAIKLDKNYPDAYQARASAYSDNGDHDRAVADYNTSIEMKRDNPIAFNNRCDELLILRHVQAALADCDESLRQRPGHANTLMHRGNAHLAAGEWTKAIADYDAALSQNPKDAWALYGRGLAKVKQGDGAGDADIARAKAITSSIAKGFSNRGIE